MNNRAINSFMEVTGASKPTAIKYLSKHHYEVDKSVDEYLSKQRNPGLVTIFNKYKEDENQIGIDGTIKYLEDLHIEPEDIKSLILCYILESPRMGVFTKEQFVNNWQKAKVYSIEEMSKYITRMSKEYQEFNRFQPVYEYVFNFLLEQPNQKLLNYELLIEYWKLIFNHIKLSAQVKERLDQWYDFISISMKNLSNDTYVMFYQFLKEVIIPDPVGLTNYDEMSSWPSLIDEYVEYLTESGRLT